MIYGATATTNYNEIASAIASGSVLSNVYLSLGIGLLLTGFAFKVALVSNTNDLGSPIISLDTTGSFVIPITSGFISDAAIMALLTSSILIFSSVKAMDKSSIDPF